MATTWSAEHGLAWVHEMRRWQDGYEQAARALPEDAVLAGNYLSKIVYARPVLVPDYAGAGFPTIVTKITWLGRPVFVNQEWLEPGKDERGVFGQQLMRSGHHVLMASGVQTYYQVLPTNATVRQVFDLHRGEWDAESNESRLQPTAERAFFRIVDRPDGALPLNGRVPANVVLRVTYLDEDANATVRVGYVNFDSGSTVELGAWHSQGNGAWVTREVTLRAGLVVTGEMFVDGAPPIRELQAVWR